MPAMSRHEMRISAFLLIFERIFNNDSIENIIAFASESEAFDVNDDSIALFKGVEEHKEILDNEISKYLKGWAISRISKVALVALRIAMYEIMFCDNVDTDIAISEAVLITQTFALKEDVSFVNGVLSSVNKDLKKEQ